MDKLVKIDSSSYYRGDLRLNYIYNDKYKVSIEINSDEDEFVKIIYKNSLIFLNNTKNIDLNDHLNVFGVFYGAILDLIGKVEGVLILETRDDTIEIEK